MAYRLAFHDLAIMALTVGLWLLDGQMRGSESVQAGFVAVLAAIMTALCGYLVHEWGHLFGTWAAGGVAHLAPQLASVFLFKFDSGQNTRKQFAWMAMGGFLASAAAVVFFLFALPLDALSGRVALALVLLGVLATFVLELPPFVRVLRGAPLPRGVAYESSE